MMNCTHCGKKLSRKSARLINNKITCTACMFPRLKGGIPQPRDSGRLPKREEG